MLLSTTLFSLSNSTFKVFLVAEGISNQLHLLILFSLASYDIKATYAKITPRDIDREGHAMCVIIRRLIMLSHGIGMKQYCDNDGY